MISKLKDFICFNQGQLLQYEYIIAKKHTALKNILNKPHYKKTTSISDKDKDILINILTTLYIDGEKELLSVLDKNTQKILDIFGKQDLFYTVKVLDLDENENDVTFDFFDSSIKKINKFNPSLVNQNKEIYKIINYGKRDFIDSDNKTIIIPMTLRANEDLTSEFKDGFFTEDNVSKIWGLVYFNTKSSLFEKEDLDICHIISDILSLYFMFFHDHIDGSASFKKAFDLIDAID
jgi:hypothetical protein